MSTQVTVTLSDEAYRHVERLAQLMGRNVADVLADTIDLSLTPLGPPSEKIKSVSELSDQEVLSLADLQMDPAQDRRLSVLLDRQQAGLLTEAERAELLALMQIYQEGLLRKAQALHEAVRRGLREPLEP
jgi:ABC-type metal ion transport system substrate-binding protein